MEEGQRNCLSSKLFSSKIYKGISKNRVTFECSEDETVAKKNNRKVNVDVDVDIAYIACRLIDSCLIDG